MVNINLEFINNNFYSTPNKQKKIQQQQQEEEIIQPKANLDNKIKPRGQIKKIIIPQNKMARPSSAPKKGQQALDQIAQIEKKILTIKDAYNLKGSDFEFKGNQVRIRSAQRKPNQVAAANNNIHNNHNNQPPNFKIQRKGTSPSADRQYSVQQQQQSYPQQNQVVSLQSQSSQPLQTYQKYLTDANGTRGAITASIRFHRTPDQTSNRVFKISQRGGPITANHNSSKGFIDTSQNSIQQNQHPLTHNQIPSNSKLRPTSANPRGFKRERSNDQQNNQHNISYTQGNMSFENSYMNISQSHNLGQPNSTKDQQQLSQKFPYQYPVLKRNNNHENNYDQMAMQMGKSLQNNTQQSLNQGQNTSFNNSSNSRIVNNNNNPNSSYTNSFNGSGGVSYNQSTGFSNKGFSQQNQYQQRTNYAKQSPSKNKREVTFSEEDDPEAIQYSNQGGKPVQFNNYFQAGGNPQQEYSQNQGSYHNYSHNNSQQRNQLPPQHTQSHPKQYPQQQIQQGNRKYFDDFQPEEIDQYGNKYEEEEEVNEVIQEEDEEGNGYAQSNSGATASHPLHNNNNNDVENYELDWDEDYNTNEEDNAKGVIKQDQVKRNQSDFLNNLKQLQKDEKVLIDQDIERKKKEHEDLQKRIEELKEIEKQEKNRLTEQERQKQQNLSEFSNKEQQLNQRIQQLMRLESEEKQKYAKLQEQEEKARLERLQELEHIEKQTEEQKQKLEQIKQLETSSALHRSMRIGSEEQLGSQISERPSSSKRILIKKSSGLHIQANQSQQENDLSEDYLNSQLRSNQNYIIIKEFSEKDININESEKPSSSSSSRMTSSSVSTRRGLLAVVYEVQLQILILMYVDNQIRLQQSHNTSFQQVMSSSTSLRRKNDQWHHSMDWSDCNTLFDLKSPEQLKKLFDQIFESQISQHIRVNLKERLITIANLQQIEIVEQDSPITLKVHLKKNSKSSYVELDNSIEGLIEKQNYSLLSNINENDIIEKYTPIKIFYSSGIERSGIFITYYNRAQKQIIFEFVTLLSEIDYTRNVFRHVVDVSQLSDHFKGGDYLNHSEYTKIINMIYEQYQHVSKLVRAHDEKGEENQFYPLKIPFNENWRHLEIVQDTPKHTIEAQFLIIKNEIGLSTLLIEETLKEKIKTELTNEDYENLIENANYQLLQKIEERDLIENYHQAQIVSIKNKNKENKTKHGVLGAYYLRESTMMIIEFIAVRNFDIDDTHTYQHTIDLRLLSQHYNNGEYLTNDSVTKVLTEIIQQYKQVQSKITIEPHYLKVPLDQDWMFEEITENEETKIYTFFNFSSRPQGKTIVEKKQTIQNLLPVKKNKKSQPKYSQKEEQAALKIQKHVQTQNKYQATKKQIQNTKKYVFAKTLDIENLPYFITLYLDLNDKQYYSTVQSLSSRKRSLYIQFKQHIQSKISEILETPDIFFQYYILDANNKKFIFYDKKNVAATKITNFFFRIKKQKSTKNKAQRANLPFKVMALRKINFEDKYYLFTIIEKKKGEKRKQYSAKIETLNQKGLNRWKSEVKLSSIFANAITSPQHTVASQNKLSKKQKKINPFNYVNTLFDIDFDKRQIHVKQQAEKQIASHFISKNIRGQYQVQAKVVVQNPFNTNQSFLFSIIKATNKKSRGFSSILESIKSKQQVKLPLKLKSLEAKYLISQITKNAFSFEQEVNYLIICYFHQNIYFSNQKFNLDLNNNVFELKQERRQVIAHSYITSFIKSRLRFIKLIKEMFIYQIKKTVQTELHGKRVKYMFTITKKLKDKITTAKVSVVQGKNRIRNNLNLPNVFGKLFNFENRLMNDKWDPTYYFEIDPEYGFFEWKKGKKEETAIKLIISCLRRRHFRQQIKNCQKMKYIHRVTPNILLTIREIDNENNPYLIRADQISKNDQNKVKPGQLRISKHQYENLIQSGKDLKEIIKVDTDTLHIRLEEDLINFQSEPHSAVIHNASENVSPLKKRQNSGLLTQNEIQEDFASISRAYQSNQRQNDERDLEISPSIDKQSDNEEDFGRSKIRLESAFDKNTQQSNSKSQFLEQSRQNFKEEFNAEVQSSQQEQSKPHKQVHDNKQENQKTKQVEEFDLEDLEYDESFDNQKQSPKKSVRTHGDEQRNSSNKKHEELYTLEEFNESHREEENKNEDNQYYESARKTHETNQSEKKHASEQKSIPEVTPQKEEVQHKHDNNHTNQKDNSPQHEWTPEKQRESDVYVESGKHFESMTPILKKQKSHEQDKSIQDFARISVTEEEIFDQSTHNLPLPKRHAEAEQHEIITHLQLDPIEIYNIVKKTKGDYHSTFTLTSQLDLETAQIVFSCPSHSSIKQMKYKINLNKLGCGALIEGKTKQELKDINQENVINEVQDYIYNNLLVYIVESSEIIVLSEDQLKLILKLQNKFICKHYRHRFQMSIADEFISTSYSCFVQIGASKKDIFILVITKNLSQRDSNSEYIKKFAKLSNVSVRKIARNQQKYLYDNIHFDSTNKYFKFDVEKFQHLIEQEKLEQQKQLQEQLLQQQKLQEEEEQLSKEKQNEEKIEEIHLESDKVEKSSNSNHQNQLEHQLEENQKASSSTHKEEIQHPDHVEHKSNNDEKIEIIHNHPIKNVKDGQEVHISARYYQHEKKIVFAVVEEQILIQPLSRELKEIEDLNAITQNAKDILSHIIIDKNQIIYIGTHEDSSKKLTAAMQKEDIVKSIDISIASSKKSGNAEFGRKGQKWFIKLYTYNYQDVLNQIEDKEADLAIQYKPEKVQTDELEISQMSKEKRQKIIKYFGLLINSNIEVIQDNLKFQDKEGFLKTIELQIYQSPKKEQVLA